MAGAFYLEHQFRVFSRMSFSDLMFYASLFAAYIVLLDLEVRASARRGGAQARFQWAGFGFTAGVGIMWGSAISTNR